MKYYAVAEIDISDPSWVEGYVANVTGLVERNGGRYLARTTRAEKVERASGHGQRSGCSRSALAWSCWGSSSKAFASASENLS